MKPAVIAIDGPAGAGKSTVARRLAQSMGYQYVDTGAMYRVVGLVAADAGVDLGDATALEKICDELELCFEEREDGVHTLANGRDVSHAIRSAEAGQHASKVSAVPVVRERLVALQRAMGERAATVMEGRDIGTVVFPDAAHKIFLRASVRERARRRGADLAARGEPVELAAVEAEIAERDERDSNRAHSPLRPAADALIVDTTEDGIDAVVARILDFVKRREDA